MTTALSILFAVLVVGLLMVATILPNRSAVSAFERKKRRELGNDTKMDDLRERRYADIESLRRIVLSCLTIFITVTAVGLFGWWPGLIVALLVAVTYGMIARNFTILRFAQRLYDEQETRLLEFVQQHAAVFKWLRHTVSESGRGSSIGSKDELEHIITKAHAILSPEEMKLLTGSLKFESRLVHHVMTPKKDIFSIKKSEILGPLVLDDLHKSGYDSFPVTNGTSLDDIVGIVRLRDVQTLDTNRRHTAKVETAMDPGVTSVGSNESLTAALKLLLDSQHHMLIVKDDSDKVVGLITLQDIIKSLFGIKR